MPKNPADLDREPYLDGLPFPIASDGDAEKWIDHLTQESLPTTRSALRALYRIYRDKYEMEPQAAFDAAVTPPKRSEP